MKNIFLLHSLLLSLSVGATETVVVSPNGDIKVTIGENNGNPVYSVNYKNIPFILKIGRASCRERVYVLV